MIDSLNGYFSAMPQEHQLLLQMHELLSYLNERRTTTFLIHAQQGLIGDIASARNVSFLADAVILLRFFEAGGRLVTVLIRSRAASPPSAT